jgi:hypothetical protein
VQPTPSPRDLPDRILRHSLQHPANLRDFLRAVVPQLADGFVCEQARLLDREFFLDDWRRREADLPFEIPYRTGVEELLALVYVLIEHQSDTDTFIPLRMLYSTVVYWDRQWREWEALPRPRPLFRLRPVLPLVLYTGPNAWGSNRALSDLLGEPVAFHPFAPDWRLLFWNLSDQTPEGMLRSGAEWLKSLSVARAEKNDQSAFHAVAREALERLQALQGQDIVRWSELIRIVLAYVLYRRPADERQALLEMATAVCQPLPPEGTNMVKTIADSLIEEGEARGALRTARAILRALLENRFGSLPEAIVQQIDAATDPARLQAAILLVSQVEKVEDLPL